MENVKEIIEKNEAVALYFSAPACNVCKSLKPKLFEGIKQNFDRMKIIEIDVSKEQKLSANFNVFSIPTLLVFLDGREFLRKSRYMSINEVIETIKRPYDIMFS